MEETPKGLGAGGGEGLGMRLGRGWPRGDEMLCGVHVVHGHGGSSWWEWGRGWARGNNDDRLDDVVQMRML